MKQMVVLIALLLGSATAIQGRVANQTQTLATRAEVELRKVEAQRSIAIQQKDMKTLDRIYADDFRGVATSGRIINKAHVMETFTNSDPRLTFAVTEIAVRVFGNTAVVTGRLTATTPDDKPAGASLFQHVYVKRSGRWQFIAGQATGLV